MTASTNQLIKQVVHHCKQRCPEALDQIFDNLPMNINEQVLTGILIAFQKDMNTLSWLCGYFCGEIARSEDNHRPFHPITSLSSILIKAGMEPFIDFTPYPGCRLVITNITKFEALPQSVKSVVNKMFNLVETPDEQMEQMNTALLQELVVKQW